MGSYSVGVGDEEDARRRVGRVEVGPVHQVRGKLRRIAFSRLARDAKAELVGSRLRGEIQQRQGRGANGQVDADVAARSVINVRGERVSFQGLRRPRDRAIGIKRLCLST